MFFLHVRFGADFAIVNDIVVVGSSHSIVGTVEKRAAGPDPGQSFRIPLQYGIKMKEDEGGDRIEFAEEVLAAFYKESFMELV